MRFWISVLGLVIGLQSVCVAAHSDDLKSPDRAVQVSETPASETQVNETPVSEAPVSEVTPKRDRDHSARSLQEMLILFLKGAVALTAIVLVYKGLKRWFGRKRESE
ncbi:hypothetical protein V4R08_05750 [Nitrobacter sp. NHB1]|uniref:hypothetical protein n=1 Tax=Nitrobacter sp. NHB1 TaxID=3119830 RepID=UPI002FFEE888